MKVYGYARVSTEEQAMNANALDQQITRLIDAGATQVIADIASRMDNDRPGLNRLKELINLREIDIILVTRLDRLTASPTLFEQFSECLEKHHVKLSGLDSYIDSSTVQGQVINDIEIAVNRGEVLRLRQRVKRGIEHRRRNKKPNQQAPFGYIVMDDRYCLDTTPFLCLIGECDSPINEQRTMSKADIARDLIDTFFQIRSLGKTAAAIHARYGILKFKAPAIHQEKYYLINADEFLNQSKRAINRKPISTSNLLRFTRSGIKALLTNPVYTGDTRYGLKAGLKDKSKIVVHYDTHPDQALLTRAQAQEILEIIEQNRQHRGWGEKSSEYPLSGLLYCAACRGRMRVVGRDRKRKKDFYYQCLYSYEKACLNRTCLKTPYAYAYVIELLTQRAIAIANKAIEIEKPIDPVLTELRSQHSTLSNLNTNNPAITEAIAHLALQIENREKQLIYEDTNNSISFDIFSKAAGSSSYWESLTMSDKRIIYRCLIERIWVNNGQIVGIDWKV